MEIVCGVEGIAREADALRQQGMLDRRHPTTENGTCSEQFPRSASRLASVRSYSSSHGRSGRPGPLVKGDAAPDVGRHVEVLAVMNGRLALLEAAA